MGIFCKRPNGVEGVAPDHGAGQFVARPSVRRSDKTVEIVLIPLTTIRIGNTVRDMLTPLE